MFPYKFQKPVCSRNEIFIFHIGHIYCMDDFFICNLQTADSCITDGIHICYQGNPEILCHQGGDGIFIGTVDDKSGRDMTLAVQFFVYKPRPELWSYPMSGYCPRTSNDTCFSLARGWSREVMIIISCFKMGVKWMEG